MSSVGKSLLIRLPDELRAALEADVPAGERTAFIVEAVREKMARIRALRELERVTGLMNAEEYPEFASSESVIAWVDRLRAIDTRWAEEKEGR